MIAAKSDNPSILKVISPIPSWTKVIFLGYLQGHQQKKIEHTEKQHITLVLKKPSFVLIKITVQVSESSQVRPRKLSFKAQSCVFCDKKQENIEKRNSVLKKITFYLKR